MQKFTFQIGPKKFLLLKVIKNTVTWIYLIEVLMEKKLLELFTKKVTSNKIRHMKVEKKLNGLAEKVKVISTKGLTKDLINNYSILNEKSILVKTDQKII